MDEVLINSLPSKENFTSTDVPFVARLLDFLTCQPHNICAFYKIIFFRDIYI